MYIINGYECDCVLYANENHVKVCYNNEEEWFNSTNQCKCKYKNQCLLGNETDCKFKVEGEGSNNYLQKCFPSKKECSDNNYYFFDENTCWASWPTGKFANALNSPYLPGLDDKGNICSSECTHPYSYYSHDSKICKLSCDIGEYLNPNNNHEYLSSCSSNFIGENNECHSLCNRTKYPYIIEYSNEKGMCVSSCANYGKYYKLDNNICKDTCDFGDGNPYYYNSDNNCLSTCASNSKPEKYDYVDSKLPLQSCLDESAKDKYYYYDNKNKLYDTYNFFEIVNSHKCSYCSGKYVYNNYCVNKCPLDAPYFVNIPHSFFKKSKKYTFG